jgi:hypothetical protein
MTDNTKDWCTQTNFFLKTMKTAANFF